MNPKRFTPRNIIIKMGKVKNKEKILKGAREKQLVHYIGAPIRLPANSSTETLQARRDWHEICKVMKSKEHQTTLFYPVRLPFKIEREIKSFQGKQKS